MPARQLTLPPRAEDPIADLAELITGMSPERLAAFARLLPPEDLALVEQIIADRTASGWRTDPAVFAHHLDPTYRLLAYNRLLADAFRRAVTGQSKRQVWNLQARLGKPVHDDALVLMADGSRRPLRDVQPGDMVVTHQGRARRVDAVHIQGELPTVLVRTRAGRVTRCAPDHPFLTTRGWVEAQHLRPSPIYRYGDVLATVASPGLAPPGPHRRPEEFRIAGYLIGDGSVTPSGSSSFACQVTCADPTEQADIEACAAALGWRVSVATYKGNALRLGLKAGSGGRKAGPQPWIRATGIAGHNSHTKRVPAWVFTAPDHLVAEFVGAYFACDGTASGHLEFYSVSHALLGDVQHLLLRFGIQSSLQGKTGTYLGKPHSSYRLRVLRQDGIARFVEAIPVHHAKAERLAELAPIRQEFPAPLLPDPVESVTTAPPGPCRCLTVADDATFTADDLVVHNSLLASQWGPTWAMDHTSGRARIILWSYGKSLAVENAVGIRDRLAEHQGLLTDGCQLAPGRRRMDRFVTTAGGGVLAAGVGGAVRGFGAGAGGGIVCDDPFKDWQEAHSENRRNLVWNQYRGTLLDRLDDEDAWIIVVHHRVHEDDLTGRLLADQASEDGDEWEHIVIPGLAGENDPLGRPVGEPVDPERFSATFLASQARAMGSYLFSALVLQAPSPEEGTDLLRAWFRLYEQPPTGADQALTSWDLKLKDREQGDYVVGQAWARTGPDYWMRDQLRGQWDHATTANAIALLAVRNPDAKTHVIEKAASYDEVAPLLRKAQARYKVTDEMAGRLGMTDTERAAVQRLRRRGMTGIIGHPVTQGAKPVRARTFIAPAAEAGNIHLPAYAEWLPHLLDELAAFPNATHDDQVDAMSQALQRLGTGTSVVAAAKGRLPKAPTPAPGPQRAPAGPVQRGRVATARVPTRQPPRRLGPRRPS
jgi:predicted phage terminase large subunit-like protein